MFSPGITKERRKELYKQKEIGGVFKLFKLLKQLRIGEKKVKKEIEVSDKRCDVEVIHIINIKLCPPTYTIMNNSWYKRRC